MKKKKVMKRRERFKDHNFSDLSGHRRDGTKLRPPIAQIDKFQTSSWGDDHLPSMVWAALLCVVFPRDHYLACFREILNTAADWFSEGGVAFESPPKNLSDESDFCFTALLDFESLAKLPDDQFKAFIRVPLKHPLGYAALRPIGLLDSIPGVERWRKSLDIEPEAGDWDTLGNAIAHTLDHQSEASTDIRWFKVMLAILARRVVIPSSFEKHIEEVLEFPNKGNMRSVRPFIRSMEMMFRRKPGAKWVADFWQECADRTGCVDSTDPEAEKLAPTALQLRNVLGCRETVILRFMICRTSVRTDSRLDASFGLVFYALAIIDEIGAGNCHEGILGRLGLRALVEAYLTFRYLCLKNDEKLWSSWRVFGAGQAKLAFLKAQEIAGDLPSFIDEEVLHQIANEDRWQEFLDIDIGHWARSNLRTIAEQCGAKDVYDKYYSWSSTFVHSHWGAVRDTNFITCQNPLHRLHRIPRMVHRRLTSMESDAATMVNEMLNLLDQLYPGTESLIEICLQSATAQSVEDA
jgi:hypothetical protein